MMSDSNEAGSDKKTITSPDKDDQSKKSKDSSKETEKKNESKPKSDTKDPKSSSEPKPKPEQKNKPKPSYNGRYNPNGADRDCSDFSTQAEAQAFFIAAGPGDPHDLDRDGDGIACDTLP
ncbi:excalibur calcium-binding domain-containing protein [Marininema halotolerans]|nr:excalibur calcium-binding domain-containing protein [Marininema halotolerans]